MSHIKGKDERTLKRLVKRYGTANVIGESHEIAGRRRNPRRRSPRHELTVFDKRWLAIARQTLKMPDAMVGVMGGMSKMEAREIVRELTGAKPGEEEENPRRRRRVSKRARRYIAGKGYRVPTRRRRNPVVGILSANPRGLPRIVRELSRRTYDVAYKHTQDGGPYKHSFGTDVHISLLSDGNVLLWHPRHSLWKRFA